MQLNEKKDATIKLTGKVTRGNFSKGSKSEHAAMYLETNKGSFVLRRAGGNPFADPALQKLDGKTITAEGILDNRTFYARQMKVEADKGQ
jgi:hypothetical protein